MIISMVNLNFFCFYDIEVNVLVWFLFVFSVVDVLGCVFDFLVIGVLLVIDYMYFWFLEVGLDDCIIFMFMVMVLNIINYLVLVIDICFGCVIIDDVLVEMFNISVNVGFD